MKEEELKQLKVKDIIAMPDFMEEMKRQLSIEENTQTEAILRGNYKRTPLDRLRERGVFKAEKMVELYTRVLDKTLIGFSNQERTYINGIGILVFSRVLKRLQDSVVMT